MKELTFTIAPALSGTPLRRLLLLTALPFLLAVSPSSPVNSTASSLDDLHRLFEVDLPTADFVILLDASLSMHENRYPDLRQALIDFIPTLGDKDSLHLRVFGDTVSTPLEGNGADLASSVETFLPKEPLFSYTDLGLAIFKALEFLERDDANEIQAFFLITDGYHEPPEASPYRRNFADDPNWQALKHRASALSSRHKVLVYGFGLGRQTDVAVLRHIFPAETVEVVVGGPAHVVHTLRSLRERLSRAQLRQAIEHELSAGGVEARLENNQVEVDGDSFDLTLTIRNGYRRLPVAIERIDVQREELNLSASTQGLQGAKAQSTDVSTPRHAVRPAEVLAAPDTYCVIEQVQDAKWLQPGDHINLRVAGALLANSPGFRIGRIERASHATFRLTPVVRFPDQPALDALAIDVSRARIEAPILSVQLKDSYGTPYWLIALIAGSLLALAAIALITLKKRQLQKEDDAQRELERRRLAGMLRIWIPGRDGPGADLIDLASLQEQELNLVAADGGRLEVIAAGIHSTEVIARLCSRPASGANCASEQPRFQIASVGRHTLAYESGVGLRDAATLTLCYNDLIVLDGRWRVRYSNDRLRTRAEVESAELGGNYEIQ